MHGIPGHYLNAPNVELFEENLAKLCEHQEAQLTTVARAYLDNAIKNGDEFVSRIEEEPTIIEYKALLDALESFKIVDGIEIRVQRFKQFTELYH